MTEIYILIALTAIMLVLLCVNIILFVLKKNGTSGDTSAVKKIIEDTAKDSKENLRDIKSDIVETLKMNNDMTANTVNLMMQNVEKDVNGLSGKVATLVDYQQKSTSALERRMIEFMTNVDAKLENMRGDNEKQLDKMRETVDEKLSSTLEERFNALTAAVTAGLKEVKVSIDANTGSITLMDKNTHYYSKTQENVKSNPNIYTFHFKQKSRYIIGFSKLLFYFHIRIIKIIKYSLIDGICNLILITIRI